MSPERHLALGLDPCLLMRQAGLDPDPWQRDFLRSSALRTLLCCSRQVGKSTVAACVATHVAQFSPGSLVIIGAPSQAQSIETFRKVTGFYKRLGAVHPEAESSQRLELPNGSRIVSLSGNPETCRGYSGPRLILLDEGAFISDDFFHAITPMLAAGGRLIGMSTPNGRQGWFYDAWEHGGDTWERVMITADDVPHRVTPEFLATEMASKPRWRTDQEYFCRFCDTDQNLFPTDLITSAITPDVKPILPGFTW